MKNKINKQFLLVAASIIVVVAAIVLVGLFRSNKTSNSQPENIKPQEEVEAASESISVDRQENSFIPLSKGTYWTYRITGEQLIDDGQGNKLIKTDELFKVEVLDYLKRDSNLRAALLTGFPGYSKTTSTLIVTSEKEYYIVWGDEPFRRISDAKDDLTDLYYYAYLLLQFPLSDDKKFGCDDEYSMNQIDNYYCNWVKSIKPADAKFYQNKNQYHITFYTNPDDTDYYYVDNVGVTYYNYSHNGTLVEEKWNLVKYSIAK